MSPTFLYVVMEHLDGPDLSDWMLSEEAAFSPEKRDWETQWMHKSSQTAEI